MSAGAEVGAEQTSLKADGSLDPKTTGQPPAKIGMWAWYKQKPLARWPFCFFLVCGIAVFACAVISLASSIFFIIGGIVGMLMTLFGFSHLRTLLNLKEEVDKYERLNGQFKEENQMMAAEVNKLSKAVDELGGVGDSLTRSNARLKENVTKFKQLEENLSKLAGDNIEGLSKLQEDSAKMMEKWNESLIKHEKDVLDKLYDQFGMKDDDPDMDRDEFKEFVAAMPAAYQRRIANMGDEIEKYFEDDDKIDFEEFSQLMDQFAEAEAQDGGAAGGDAGAGPP